MRSRFPLPRVLGWTVLASLGLTAGTAAATEATLRGAGATLPQAVYEQWARAYAIRSGVQVAYDGLGSGEGVRRLQEGSVDFGASDMPLPLGTLTASGLVQFPGVIGGVVPVVNLPGIAPGALRLSGPLLADILMGRVKTWDDPAVVALNPALPLPSGPIRPVHRGDSSGSTFVLTTYLAKVNAEWKGRVGAGPLVKWPAGEERDSSHSIATYVQQAVGAIGYVDYAHAFQKGMSWVRLRNRAGEYAAPEPRSFAAAAVAAPWNTVPAFALTLIDQPGSQSWPLTTPTFLLMKHTQADSARAAKVLAFFHWAYHDGGAIASSTGYVALPPAVVSLVQAAWRRQIKSLAGEPVWTMKVGQVSSTSTR